MSNFKNTPSNNNNFVFVDYHHTLFEPSSMETPPKKRLRIKFGDAVDEFGTVDQCELRLHRNCDLWVQLPPLTQSQQPQEEQPQEIKKKPKFKIKYTGKPKNESKFKNGEIVEVSSDEEGYKDAWFVATIVDIIGKDRFLVEYRDLLMNDDDTQHLKEEIDAKFIRPCPPQVPTFGSFRKLQEVDAWYNDGWWQGMVVEFVNKTEYFVQFMNNELLKFESSKLRPRQNWIDGKWVMSSEKSIEPVKNFGAVKPFYKGQKVEVRSDEKGYEGSWYTAIVVDLYQNGKCLVEYLTLKTDDLTKQLKEVVDVSNIRPYPPNINFIRPFVTHEKVDVWYNDGWWEGEVSSVGHGLNGFEYKVYFSTSNEELEFRHDYLRPHQEWFDGRWVLASLG